MNIERFVFQRSAGWEKLKDLLSLVDRRGWQALGPSDLEELGRLYRKASADLAYARANYPGSREVSYLNGLVAAAHSRIYAGRAGSWRRLRDFFRSSFPETVRGNFRPVALSAGIFALAAAAAFLAVRYDPGLSRLVLPESLRRAVEEGLSRGRAGAAFPEALRPLISSQIMVNNVQVAFLAFATGIGLGLGTVYVLFQNGLFLGGLASLFHARGFAVQFWSLILPHGIIELSAIFLAAGAGLMLGGTLIDPGELRRKDALVLRGKGAMNLVVGAIPMFVVAAGIEGFVTPLSIPPAAKLAAAVLTLVPLALYLRGGPPLRWPGRRPPTAGLGP